MTLKMQIQTTPFGEFTQHDFESNGLFGLEIERAYSHPMTAKWSANAAQHTTPLGYGTYVRIWHDDKNDADGNPQSESNPLFEGHIEEIQPAESNKVDYVAYEPTAKAGREVQVMSQPWNQGDIPNEPPTEGSGAVPRAVFNVSIDNDDDHQHSQGQGLTVGGILKRLFDDAYHPLYWRNAASGDGTSAGNGSAYVQADLDLMTFQPQEKLVFESESIRSAVERMLGRYAPAARIVWDPATRKWRFDDINQVPSSITLTLNQFDGTKDVHSLDMERSIEGRATAIKYYGPESHVAALATTEDGSLQVYDETDYIVLERLGSVEIRSYDKWQISDAAKRKMGLLLPDWITVGMGGYRWKSFRSPSFQASWDGGATWTSIKGVYFDTLNGVAFTGHVFFFDSEGHTQTTGVQHYFPPDHVRLLYAYIGDPITVRSPASGYDGTAYTEANVAYERRLYDESLAVGYELGTPVTTVTRLAQFQILANAVLSQTKDVIYMGGCTIDGIDYDFADLNRGINFAGVDEDGNSVTTGWESISAILTDVEYDYDQRLTTIRFNSDYAELAGVDVEMMKRLLKIRALQRRFFGRFSVTVTKAREFTEFGTPVIGTDIQIGFESVRGFENPFTGGLDLALSPNPIGEGL